MDYTVIIYGMAQGEQSASPRLKIIGSLHFLNDIRVLNDTLILGATHEVVSPVLFIRR